jgi:hypothetical protein
MERERERERERLRERQSTKHVFEIEREIIFLLKSANKEQALNHSMIFSTKQHT